MSRLVDYFIVTGYDHDKDRKLIRLLRVNFSVFLVYCLTVHNLFSSVVAMFLSTSSMI